MPHPHQLLWGLYQICAEDLRTFPGVRVVSEMAASSEDYTDWGRMEAVANVALRDLPVRGLCLANSAELMLPQERILACTHPTMHTRVGTVPNPNFQRTRSMMRRLDRQIERDPMEAVPPHATSPLVSGADLAALRELIQSALVTAAIEPTRQEEFLEAVFEVATNALLHGGSSGSAAIWAGSGRVLCRIRDDGPGLDDPLSGYLPPLNGQGRGTSGLWTARQLCDRLTTTLEPDGFTVRLHVGT